MSQEDNQPDDIKDEGNQTPAPAPSTEEKPDEVLDVLREGLPEVKPTAKPAAEQPKDAPKADEKPEPKTEDTSEEEEGKPDEGKPDEGKPADDSEEKPTGSQVRKEELNAEIRSLNAQKNALKAEIEKKNNEFYAPASEEELVNEVNPETGEKYTASDAKVEALRQEMEMDRYNSRVADAQLTIYSESKEVLDTMPIFNPKSEDYEEELAKEVGAYLDDQLIHDENTGELIGSNVSPLQLYQFVYKGYQLSAQKNQIKGQKAHEQMMSSADTPSGTPTPKPKEDPILAILKSDD